MMPAMPKGVILDHELRGHWSAKTKGKGSGAIELFVRKCAHCFRSLAAVCPEELEGLKLVDGHVLACMLRVQVGDRLPRNVSDWLAGRDSLSKLDLNGVHARNMMHHGTDGAPVR